LLKSHAHSLLQSFTWVWSQDPAVDAESPGFNLDAYLSTGDRAHLPLREGATPTEFTLMPLSRSAYQHVLQSHSEQRVIEALTEALAYGLRSVQNLDDDGKPFAVKRVPDHPRGERATSETIDKLFSAGGQALISELGIAVFKRSVPGPLSR
jgi:hypothetical protein